MNDVSEECIRYVDVKKKKKLGHLFWQFDMCHTRVIRVSNTSDTTTRVILENFVLHKWEISGFANLIRYHEALREGAYRMYISKEHLKY